MFTGLSLEEVTYEPLDIPDDFLNVFDIATSIITTVLYYTVLNNNIFLILFKSLSRTI